MPREKHATDQLMLIVCVCVTIACGMVIPASMLQVRLCVWHGVASLHLLHRCCKYDRVCVCGMKSLLAVLLSMAMRILVVGCHMAVLLL
eukprot:1775153-Alexandrium_andersonii.AAC.1